MSLAKVYFFSVYVFLVYINDLTISLILDIDGYIVYGLTLDWSMIYTKRELGVIC